jgi:hypothetical protein
MRAILKPLSMMIFIVLFLPPPASASDIPSLRLVPAAQVIPASSVAMQEIAIEIDAPEAEGEEFEAAITAESKYGVLLFPGAPSYSGSVVCRAGTPFVIKYRWAGALPTDGAIEERITASVPGLQLTAQTGFSVGKDMRLTGVTIPDDVESGRFSAIEVKMTDTFHPDAPLDEILSRFGITPELEIRLVSSIPMEIDETRERVLARFFGVARKPKPEISYPGGEFKPGLLFPDMSRPGEFLWRSVDGRDPGIAPPFPGRYNVTALLKPNTGGIAIRELSSRSFDVVGEPFLSLGLPGLTGPTVEILSALNPALAETAAQGAREKLSRNDEEGAAALLGEAMKGVSADTPARTLSRYVDALIASGESIDSIARFVQNFLIGYDDLGMLILTKSGVKSWNFSEEGGPFLENDAYVLIPFNTDKNFILNAEGSGDGDTSIWKIVRRGVNKKDYPAGDWEKEITVHTGLLTPP